MRFEGPKPLICVDTAAWPINLQGIQVRPNTTERDHRSARDADQARSDPWVRGPALGFGAFSSFSLGRTVFEAHVTAV